MENGSCGNVIAALASFFIPGLGQLLQGRWDPTRELLEARDRIAASAAALPYCNGWRQGAE